MKNDNQKEASRRKSLGELGELIAIKVLVDNKFEKIINLNDRKINFPFADIYAEKNGERLIISVKARNKYQKDNKLNAFYNLGSNFRDKAIVAQVEYDKTPYWMAIQFDKTTYSVFFGSVEELGEKNAIPLSQCEEVRIGSCLARNVRHYFDFEYFGNK
jgi:hypothetical protein